MKNNKGDYIWISWVLLMAFSVALSALMYNWIFGYTTASTEKIEERAFNAQECDFIGISLDSYCQDSKNLYLDVTNRNSLHVNRVLIKMFDVYNDPVIESIDQPVLIEPGKTSKIVVPKQGLIKTVEVVPAVIKKKTEIICSNRVAKLENIQTASASC